VVGEFFTPDQVLLKNTLVIVLGGSAGGLRHAPIAERFAEHGIQAFALAYFGLEGLPSQLDHIPLEYFHNAFSFILAKFGQNETRLVCMGHSRGAELALQLAASSQSFAGLIATSPSYVRWGAVGFNKPSWLLNGVPLPYVDPVPTPDLHWPIVSLDGRDYVSCWNWYLTQLENSPTVNDAAIPVEKITCPVLLFSGLDDQLWPSALFADKIEQRLLEASRTVENIQYEGVGHVIPLPDETPRFFSWNDTINSGLAYGGSDGASSAAATDRWDRILNFLNKLT